MIVKESRRQVGFSTKANVKELRRHLGVFMIRSSSLRGAWKCNSLPLMKIMTDRPTEQPTDGDLD